MHAFHGCTLSECFLAILCVIVSRNSLLAFAALNHGLLEGRGVVGDAVSIATDAAD
jgi:hypothetical protein